MLLTLPRTTEDGKIIYQSAMNKARHNTPMCYIYYWANWIYFIIYAGINVYFTRYNVYLIISFSSFTEQSV